MIKHDESSGCQRHHLHDVYHDGDTLAARVQNAEAYCQQHGLRFTLLRRQVYQLILSAKQPLGAYDLIAQLQKTRQRQADVSDKVGTLTKQTVKPVAPPTIYRTLSFLLAQGFIHQLTSMNAFIPCCHPRNKHTAIFLICNSCQRVQECSSTPVQKIFSFATNEMQFAVQHSIMELSGLCNLCQEFG